MGRRFVSQHRELCSTSILVFPVKRVVVSMAVLFFVSLDDPLHQSVANDVGSLESDDSDPLDLAQPPQRIAQAAGYTAR